MKTFLTINELSEIRTDLTLNMNDSSIEFVNDYYCATNRCYLCDAISEFADYSVSVYSSDQAEYARTHYESAKRAFNECCMKDYIKDFDDLESIMEKVGTAAWFMDIEEELFSDIENIKKVLALDYIIDNTMLITREELEQLLEEIAVFDVDRIEEIADYVCDFLEQKEKEVTL